MEHLLLIIIILLIIFIFARPIRLNKLEYDIYPNFIFANQIPKFKNTILNLNNNTTTANLIDIIPNLNKIIPNLENAVLTTIKPFDKYIHEHNKNNLQIIYNIMNNSNIYLDLDNKYLHINKEIFISNYAPIINNSKQEIKLVVLTIKKPYWYCY